MKPTLRFNFGLVVLAGTIAFGNQAVGESTNLPISCHVEISNSCATLAFTMTNSIGRNYYQLEKLKPTTTNACVYTNTGGVWLILAAPTNRFTRGAQVTIRTLLFNASTNRFPIYFPSRVGSPPDYAEIVVKDQSRKACPKKQNRRLPESVLDPGSHTGRFSLAQKIHHEFDLSEFVNISEPGVYSVVLRGVLRSSDRIAMEFPIETAPISIIVEPAK